jgi:hypothetical protein
MWSSSESLLRCEIVIIPEMTARRLMTLAARYFSTAFQMAAAPFQARPGIDAKAYATASAG